MIDWKQNNKLCLSKADKSMFKHDTIKLAMMMYVIRKHHAAPVYTEYNYHGRFADVYFEMNGERYCVEIQRDMSNDYQKEAEIFYLEHNATPIVIPVKECPDDLNGIWKYVEKFI